MEKRTNALVIVACLQFVLILANVAIICLGKYGLMAFITAMIYFTLYFKFTGALKEFRDEGQKNKFLQITNIVSPILYSISLILAVMVGM